MSIESGARMERREREPTAPEPGLEAVFAALSGPAVLFAADGPRFTLLAVSDGLVAAAGRPRAALVGRALADAFPDPDPVGSIGLTNLRVSLESAVRTGTPHRLLGQRYDLQRADGSWEVRYWDALNTPVRGGEGMVRWVLHQTEDVTARQLTEARLRASEERYRQLFDAIDVGVCVIQVLFDEAGHPVDYRFDEVNPAFAVHTGLVDVPGRRMRELAPGHEAHWFETYGRVARTGEPARFEAPASALGRWYDVFAFRVGDPGEHRVAIVFSDIGPRKQAEAERERLVAELQRERARLDEVFHQAPVAVAVLRGRVAADLVYELVNPRYEEVIPPGRSPRGRRLGDALPELLPTHGPVLQGVLDTGIPFVANDYAVPFDRDGDGRAETYYFNFVYHPLVEADGSVAGIIGIGTEVTESVRARLRAERLQALTAALAGARTLDDVANVIVADMVLALDARTGALAGRAPEGDALVLLRTIGFPDDVAPGVRRQPLDFRSPLIECYLSQAPVWLESREGEAGLDTRFPPIAPVWDRLGVQSAAFLPLVAAGETIGVISFAFARPRAFDAADRAFLLAISRQAALAMERARLFEAEHTARDEAERANLAKGEFLAVMSHELRTPLNAIGGYAELIEMGIRGPVTSQQREDLRRIQTSQRHLLGLINEVLNYAKLETGAVHFDLTEVRVRDALMGAEALVAPQAQARALTLEVDPCPPALAVRADAEKLRQVLVNLLSNAVKFTDRGGRVMLACEPLHDMVRIHVRDSGIGIAADQLERIFEPFVQVRADLTRTAEGTGLGLAISRDLARGMGGDLTVMSEPGRGSTFTLVLPRAPA